MLYFYLGRFEFQPREIPHTVKLFHNSLHGYVDRTLLHSPWQIVSLVNFHWSVQSRFRQLLLGKYM